MSARHGGVTFAEVCVTEGEEKKGEPKDELSEVAQLDFDKIVGLFEENVDVSCVVGIGSYGCAFQLNENLVCKVMTGTSDLNQREASALSLVYPRQVASCVVKGPVYGYSSQDAEEFRRLQNVLKNCFVLFPFKQKNWRVDELNLLLSFLDSKKSFFIGAMQNRHVKEMYEALKSAQETEFPDYNSLKNVKLDLTGLSWILRKIQERDVLPEYAALAEKLQISSDILAHIEKLESRCSELSSSQSSFFLLTQPDFGVNLYGFVEERSPRLGLMRQQNGSSIAFDGRDLPLVCQMVQCLLTEVQRIHRLNIKHGDVQPKNIALRVRGGDLKSLNFIDFGASLVGNGPLKESLLQLLNPSRWYGVLVPLCPAVYFARPGVRSAVGFPPPNPSVVNAYDGDYYGLAYVIAYILFGGDLVFGSLCFNQKFLTKREENLKTLLTQLFEWANGQSFGVRSRVYWLVHAVVTALVGAVSEQDLDDFMRVRPESFNALIYFWNQDFLYEKFMTKSSLNYANCPRSKAVVSKECQRSTTLADDPLNKELFSGQNAFVSGRFCCCLGGNSALVFTEKVEGSGRMPELSELSEPVV